MSEQIYYCPNCEIRQLYEGCPTCDNEMIIIADSDDRENLKAAVKSIRMMCDFIEGGNITMANVLVSQLRENLLKKVSCD